MTTSKFKPALGLHGLTPHYDWLHSIIDPGQGFRFTVAAHLAVLPGERVLDVGCGTGSQALVLKRLVPEATIEGLDIDPTILQIARRKAAAAGIPISFVEGSADRLPFEPESFDRVVSTLAFHHLSAEAKRRAHAEVFRVLRPRGRFVLADFGGSPVPLLRAAFNLLHGERAGSTHEQLEGNMHALLRDAGFAEVSDRHVTLRMIHIFQGTRPVGRNAPSQ